MNQSWHFGVAFVSVIDFNAGEQRHLPSPVPGSVLDIQCAIDQPELIKGEEISITRFSLTVPSSSVLTSAIPL